MHLCNAVFSDAGIYSSVKRKKKDLLLIYCSFFMFEVLMINEYHIFLCPKVKEATAGKYFML